MTNLLFLGTYITDDKINEFKQISSFFDFAGILLQDSVYSGLCLSTNCSAITIPVLKTKFKHRRIPPYHYSWHNTTYNYSVGYTNIVGIKHLTSIVRALQYIKKNKIRPDVLFIYSLNVVPYTIAYILKKNDPNLKVVNMVTDLPEYMKNHNTLFNKIVKSVDKYISYSLSKCIDGYILLSPYMSERLPVENKPIVVIEGIYNTTVPIEESGFNYPGLKDKRIILYSGTIAERYGIFGLIEAFMGIEGEDLLLLVCGGGDDVDRLVNYTKQDGRIKYLGMLAHSEVTYIQRMSTLLVNPLLSSVPSTRYSFSSKTLEYLASGTPTLMAKLINIPQEYYPFLFFFEDESVEGLRKRLQEILQKSTEELLDFGNRAKEFVITNKSISVQGEKIKRFIDGI